MTDIIHKIIESGTHLSILEIVAVLLGVLQVLWAYRNNRWNFVAGIAACIIFIYLFIEVKLYAESALQVYYLVMSVYGWFAWSSSLVKESNALEISHTTTKEWLLTVAIAVLGGGLIYFVLVHHTDTDVPFFDAIVSSIAWAGTWLMTRRKVEYWLVLNVSNLIAIPLLWYKEMYFTSAFTVFLFVIAMMGYFKWRKIVVNY